MWTTETIAGRDAEIFLPSRPFRFPVLFLTDWDDQSPRENPVWERLFEDFQLSVYVLKTGDSWWADRPAPGFSEDITPQSWLMTQVAPRVRQQRALSPFGLIGLGAGGQGALRLGFKFPKEFRAVASIEGTVDLQELHGRGTSLDTMYATKEHVRQDTPVLHLRGYDVPPYLWLGCSPDSFWRRGNERLHEKLAALGLPHVIDFGTAVCGHSWSYYDTMAPRVVRYLAEGLQAESLKLM
ncbi:hypothetical protein [Zavarzinella formosa]|uniref:hypothetical protein n=1 Tax=Zavarzinella formosa TaxID=360055 RepID=UPI0002E6B2B3|nr:hypothetical protein [Zavarzinella formosa]